MLIERADRGRARAAIASSEAVGVRERHRSAAFGGCRDLGGLAHLALPVAVHLGDRDLGEVVILEEREQVVGEVVPVAVRGVRLDLEALRREPVGGELVESGIDVLCRSRIGLGRAPRAQVDVAQHDGEPALGHRQGPAVLRPAEVQIAALAVGGEPQPERRLADCRLDYISSCRARHSLPDLIRRCLISMQPRFAHGS
jgi:hypothetical protein